MLVVVQLLSRVQFFVTPRAVAQQAPLSMGFTRQEYLSGLPLPSPGDLSDPGIKPTSPALAGGFFTYSAIKKNEIMLFTLLQFAIYKTEIDAQIERIDLWLPRKRGENDWEFRISRFKLVYIEQINNKVLLYNRGNYIQYPVIDHNGRDSEKIWIYIQMSHSAIQQELT